LPAPLPRDCAAGDHFVEKGETMLIRLIAAAALIGLTAVAAGAAPPPLNPAALQRVTPQESVIVYVDYVTGLDNLMNTIPAPQYRNNVTAFSKLNRLFKMPAVLLGEENDYYGTFLPEIKQNVTHDVRRFERTLISGYTPAFRQWLKSTGRKNVIIGGISIDNCTLHTSLDLLRDGYNVYVVTDVSGSNSKIAEDMAIQRLRDAGAVPVTWLNIATELGVDFNSQYGRGLMAISRRTGRHRPLGRFRT
jgi:hypothetical protein